MAASPAEQPSRVSLQAGPVNSGAFDILKRFWVELLSPVASMHAHARFIPTALQQRFTRLTGASIVGQTPNPDSPYSLLLDLHTGIPLPNAANQNLRVSHAPIDFIVGLFDDPQLSFIACYDQTAKREAGLSLVDQLDTKRNALLVHTVHSFYYVSHAPFLFASLSVDILNAIRKRMIDAGIPTATTTTVRLQTVN